MNMNRSKLCAIALLTTTVTLLSNLAVTQAQMLDREHPDMRHKTFQISRDYKGLVCIFLGTLRQGTTVIVDWGPYEGREYINADRGQNEFYAAQIDADGDNAPFTVYVHTLVNSNLPDVYEMPCDSDRMRYPVPNPVYLQWRWRS